MHLVLRLQGFTIDGQVWDNVDDVDRDNAKQAFRDILIYVAGERRYPGDTRAKWSPPCWVECGRLHDRVEGSIYQMIFRFMISLLTTHLAED